MLITASAVQFAKLSGHEAPNEEEFYFKMPQTRALSIAFGPKEFGRASGM